MKNIVFVVIALLAGLVLGSWSERSDLRRARKEIAGLKEELSHRGQRESSLRNITSLLRVPEPAPRREMAAPIVVSNETVEAAGATSVVESVEAHPPDAATRRTMKDHISTAIELWKTRSALARDGFLANISASPVQSQMFDQTVATMNQQLGDKINQWADYLKQQQQVTPETGLRMMNDLSGIVVTAYDELNRVLTPDWQVQAGEQFQLFDFINPEVALPLTEVEGKLSRYRGPR